MLTLLALLLELADSVELHAQRTHLLGWTEIVVRMVRYSLRCSPADFRHHKPFMKYIQPERARTVWEAPFGLELSYERTSVSGVIVTQPCNIERLPMGAH